MPSSIELAKRRKKMTTTDKKAIKFNRPKKEWPDCKQKIYKVKTKRKISGNEPYYLRKKDTPIDKRIKKN